MAELEINKAILTSSSDDGNYAEFVLDPLERGYGVTLGNSLRRVLLSSIPGAAACSLKIDGVTHEFSTIPGVREDVSEIVLNVKEIVVRLNNCDSKTVYIDAKGPCEFTADKIKTDSDIEILSKNLIFTIETGIRLKMEITFSSGVGYVSADQNRAIMPAIINLIPVDSLYSPVMKVNYSVENTRVGKITDYDKLTFQVWTNGVMSAKDAVSYASDSLMRHFSSFCFSENYGNFNNFCNDVKNLSSCDDISVEDLNLSSRASNSLKRAGIERLNQLKEMSADEISGIRNLGKKSCDEVITMLKSFGWTDNRSKKSKNSDFADIINQAIDDDISDEDFSDIDKSDENLEV